MGFPFIAPLNPLLKKKFEKREKLVQNNLKGLTMPFAMLSCGAVVTKTNSGTQIKEIIKNNAWPTDATTYYGCVVTNTTDVSKLYQTGKTIVGYDLNGKPILVEGETNRRASTPIIESIEIDTDGNNNTLKIAKINLKVFTLKQLEMFELFFLRPSMDVVLEFGYGSDIRGEFYDKIQQYLFVGKGYTAWEEKFIKIFSHKDDAYKEAKQQYLTILKNTDYDYDYMSGKITGINFSPDTDGTYNVMIEISAGNELQMWMPLKQSSDEGQTKRASKNKIEVYDQQVNKLAADINLPKLAKILPKKDWQNEFFNWNMVNKNEKDTNYSKDEYISFKLILYIINNSQIFTPTKEKIKPVYFEDLDLKKPVIPVSSWKTIMSTNSSFILPGEVPKIIVVKAEKGKNKIVIANNSFHKCPINGKSFNLNTNIIYSDSDRDEEKKLKPIPIPLHTGNLLNIFLKYETFVQIFNQAYTQGDVVNSLLDEINFNMFGYCKLELQKEDSSPNGGPLTICDRKLLQPSQSKSQLDKTYRFKIGTNGSIIKEFEFNMEMSELMQGQAMFATEYDIINIIEKGKTDNTLIVAEQDAYSSADLSFLPNADGYCSINKVGVELVKEAVEWQETLKKELKVEPEDKTDETEKETINTHEVLRNNYIRFKLNSGDKAPLANNLIYQDPALIQSTLPKRQKGTTVLTFLEITITIDGTAGITSGEYFNIDGIPEIYNKNGYFQITNVKHNLSDNEWKTVIEAQYRMQSNDEDLENSSTQQPGKNYTEVDAVKEESKKSSSTKADILRTLNNQFKLGVTPLPKQPTTQGGIPFPTNKLPF